MRLAPHAGKRWQAAIFAPCMKYGTLDDMIALFLVTGETPNEDDIARLARKVTFGQEGQNRFLAFVEKKRPDLLGQAKETLKKVLEEDDIPF